MKLHGTNMSNVKKVAFEGKEADVTYNSAEDCIQGVA